MGYEQLTKRKASRVVGIDCSTNSLAYAIFEDDKPVACGEVTFEGADVFERLNDARRKTQALVDAGILVGDYIGMESAVAVKNVQVVIKLAYVYGSVLGVLMQNKMQVNVVPPITWQSYIGNPNLKKDEKDAIKAENPGKSVTWYSNKGRSLRKERTLEFSRQFFTIPNDSDNIGDAIGVAYYVSKVLTKR